jgi:hypothetical protein
MKAGWFAGSFSPSAMQMQGGEFAVKQYKKYHIECAYCHPKATVMYMLLSGSIQLNGVILTDKYDMATFAPAESVYFSALADSDVLLGVVGENSFTRCEGLSFEKMIDAYGCFSSYENRNTVTINDNELTFVVQGAIDKTITPICLQSIRAFFPGSIIILSTWRGSHVSGLDCDMLVESDDPGGIPWKLWDTRNSPVNTNRQLVSTINGLEHVKTKYAMKLRTDAVLTGKRIVSYLGAFPKRVDKMRLFEERVIVSDLYTRRYFTYRMDGQIFTVPHLFHISDWFFLGLTNDLREYFNGTRFVTEEETISAPLKNQHMREFCKYWWNWRYTTEQHYAIEAIERRYPGIKELYGDWTDWSKEAERLSDVFTGNNFIVLDLRHHGITLPRHELFLTNNSTGRSGVEGLFNQEVFERYYKAVICDGNDNFNSWSYI